MCPSRKALRDKPAIKLRLYVQGLILLTGVCLTGCPSPYTLGFPGTYPTNKFETIIDGEQRVTVYYPDTAPRLSNLPIIIFSPGWNQPRGSYEGYAKQFAQWGYIGVIRAYPSYYVLGAIRGPDPEDPPLINLHVKQCSRLIDWCAEQNLRPDSPLYGLVDAQTVGTVGHSYGAGVSLSAAAQDKRVKAAVPLDVTWDSNLCRKETLANTTAAILYIRSGDGRFCAKPPGARDQLFDYTPGPAEELTIIGADHIDFEDSLVSVDWFAELFCPRGKANAQEVRNITMRYMIPWYNVYLKGDTDYTDFFDGESSKNDESRGLVTIRRNLNGHGS